ncbi:MAG: GH92 family glycosyl hydrolase [Prevotella sp.]|jgi:predicted alpha-1,2-mannosidase|nr:GH92 family glycosyl hydrolase [Prevotella sp.]
MKQVIPFFRFKKTLWLASLFASLLYAGEDREKTATSWPDLSQYINPHIGTGGHGHVFMGASVPFGMVQLGPTNITEGWDWTSGYHVSDSTVWGFTHTHLSGTGIGDLCDIALMPVVGDVALGKGNKDEPLSGQYSLFSHKREIAKAGYYAVHLDRYNIDVELTATGRVGFHKYSYPRAGTPGIIIDLASSLNWDKPTETYLVVENDTTVSGYRHSTGWANDQRLFFTISFSKPAKRFTLSADGKTAADKELKATGVCGQVFFDADGKSDLLVKVALSPVSIENAKLNMQAELPGWNFNRTVKAAQQSWNRELSKIRIKAKDKQLKQLFYTALYHTMIAPSEFCDANNDYRGADRQIHRAAAFKNYTTFSLWDTYRAAAPLMTIIHPEKMNDIIRTMLAIYDEQGKLPVWHLMGCETNCMVGNPGIPVVADAILKGYDGFDTGHAYEAMKQSAMLDERGLKYLKEYGYIPYDKEEEGLSKCMEYAIADWCIAQVALRLGKTGDYDYFSSRSKAYARYFDPETGFMRGRSSDGKFRSPFNPFEAVHRQNDYTEGNAWQYTWLVPHDIQGLLNLFGATGRFVQKLDSLFVAEGFLGENASPDISGLIGQYCHGNEPSHHVLYIYPYIGQPWKTAEHVRSVMSKFYTTAPDGIIGNEDCGQMSAWYILSALGFYQVEPAGGKYIFGSPLLDEASIKVKDGKTFRIIAHNNSASNKYIQSIKLNGVRYDKYYIDFHTIAQGGVLEFYMGNKPSGIYGTVEDVLTAENEKR